jgi:hypothetical protein
MKDCANLTAMLPETTSTFSGLTPEAAEDLLMSHEYRIETFPLEVCGGASALDLQMIVLATFSLLAS